jgi:uncharacterized protein
MIGYETSSADGQLVERLAKPLRCAEFGEVEAGQYLDRRYVAGATLLSDPMRASVLFLLLIVVATSSCAPTGSSPDWLPPAAERDSTWDAWRAQRDSLFATDQSPLPEVERAGFERLEYFPFDSTLAFAVALEPVLSADTLRIPTTTGHIRPYVRYGRFTFYIDGRVQRLTAYRAIDQTDVHGSVFVPFTDPTNRTDTYGGGRYIDLRSNPDGRYVLDFNFAYSPYCAYDESWSCPIPPSENRLNMPISAGEKYDGDG